MASSMRKFMEDDALKQVRLYPMQAYVGINGANILMIMHKAQHLYPIQEVWSPRFRLPKKLMDYLNVVCDGFAPQVRQEAILLLKRFVWQSWNMEQKSKTNLQVVALTCANLAAKHWQNYGIAEMQLHWLSLNTFTRKDFIDAEVEVMRALDCNVHWDGMLLAEWVPILLHLTDTLLSEVQDAGILAGIAAHIADVLSFEDELMSSSLPSELAAATLHAAVILCTNRFARHSLTLRINHLCRVKEDDVAQLSEKILAVAIGGKCAELLLEGSGHISDDEELSGLKQRRSPQNVCGPSSSNNYHQKSATKAFKKRAEEGSFLEEELRRRWKRSRADT